MTRSCAAVLLALLSAGCAGQQAVGPGHGKLIRHPMRAHAVKLHAAARRGDPWVKGAIDPGALSCSGNGPVIGGVGVIKPGRANAAKKLLGKAFRAQVTDSVSGQIMFFAPAGTSSNLKSVFSKVSLVSAQASAANLHSCDMMLANLPAARPVITVAENAVVKANLAASLEALKNGLQEVLLSDTALRSGALIVTLQVIGAKRAPIYTGAPPTYSLASLTVVMNYPSLAVTAVTRGGL
jgi:hypothetical protein